MYLCKCHFKEVGNDWGKAYCKVEAEENGHMEGLSTPKCIEVTDEVMNAFSKVVGSLENVDIVEVRQDGKDTVIVWKEKDDEDKYFSRIGRNKYGKLVEMVGGEA